ncbi:ATP-dependent helicase [Marinobacterium nitratireducens]|uniref:ATP-dependent helicase n=1 Tax=Marinobacterium nitratireducens TaxID=518897 RepID=A0A918DNI8_9GAMM|nr:DEAD/DEAH box helicase [Marinobacterium nitratireducens]GGO76781.1 ATP-dependent helicase [Marinobacterium nitratireducens]
MKPEDRLSAGVQRWIYRQGWRSLRPVQVEAIEPIQARDRDIVISASTAAGKTEAFFLPAMSVVDTEQDGFSIIYISPLKALINDQHRRLEMLSEFTGIPVTPWHGDVSSSLKGKVRKRPKGILLITPESLEAMLMRHVGWSEEAFRHLQYCVIDEYHAFIGTERGQQLVSLLERVQALVHEVVPRVALSATLGDLATVVQTLRPGAGVPCHIIESKGTHSSLMFRLKGYEDPEIGPQPSKDVLERLAIPRINGEIFKVCRGGFHLIFANSRRNTELHASSLSDMCEQAHVPNEFFPHHGSLSKEHREYVESRMQKGDRPTSTICTMTLELGIDIGKVDSIIQVGTPHSVSSLRQRLGRSGRRGGPAALRMLIKESELSAKSTIQDRLRLHLFQSIALVRLLLFSRWYEPPDSTLYHFSTLLHQIMALIAQWGGVRAEQLYKQLCRQGPFGRVSVTQFTQLLRHMGETELISQMGNGELVLGLAGEKMVDDYRFYAAFKTPEEFRIIANGKTLGTLTANEPLIEGQMIIFSGRRWRVDHVDTQVLAVYVSQSRQGQPPLFGGSGAPVHRRVREEMLALYREGQYTLPAGGSEVDYLDDEAKRLFEQGLGAFRTLNLAEDVLIEERGATYVVPWLGDKECYTLAAWLTSPRQEVGTFAGIIEVPGMTKKQVVDSFTRFSYATITEAKLAERVADKLTEKFDEWLPEELLNEGYGAKFFDISATKAWIQDSVF